MTILQSLIWPDLFLCSKWQVIRKLLYYYDHNSRRALTNYLDYMHGWNQWLCCTICPVWHQPIPIRLSCMFAANLLIPFSVFTGSRSCYTPCFLDIGHHILNGQFGRLLAQMDATKLFTPPPPPIISELCGFRVHYSSIMHGLLFHLMFPLVSSDTIGYLFVGLLLFVEDVIRHEHSTCQNRPIYLVGNSFGACLAISVAARNPNIDLIIILINPG